MWATVLKTRWSKDLFTNVQFTTAYLRLVIINDNVARLQHIARYGYYLRIGTQTE